MTAAIVDAESTANVRWFLRRSKEFGWNNILTFRDQLRGAANLCYMADRGPAIKAGFQMELPNAKQRVCTDHLKGNAETECGIIVVRKAWPLVMQCAVSFAHCV